MLQQMLLSGPAGISDVVLNDWTYAASNPTQASAEVGIGWASPPNAVTQYANGGALSSYTWTAQDSANYEMYIEIVSGAIQSGNLTGSWIAAGSVGTISVIANASNGNNKAAVFILRVRHAATGIEVARATFNLSATYT